MQELAGEVLVDEQVAHYGSRRGRAGVAFGRLAGGSGFGFGGRAWARARFGARTRPGRLWRRPCRFGLDRDEERFERGQARRLAGLAVADRADLAPSTNVAATTRLMRLRRRALQPDPQAEDRQRHAAAAAELTALDPGREPAAAQHGLIFDVRRRHPTRRLQRRSLRSSACCRARPSTRRAGRQHRRGRRRAP